MPIPGALNRPTWTKIRCRKHRELGARPDITSTQTLVEAYNKTTNSSDQDVMFDWMKEYVVWFCTKPENELTSNVIKFYAKLAHIRRQEHRDRGLVEQFVSSLVTHLQYSRWHTYDYIVALDYVLCTIDTSLLKKQGRQLKDLVCALSACIDPEDVFTRTTYKQDALTLFALHRTLVVLQREARTALSTMTLETLMEKMRMVEKSAEYYPYVYVARMVKRAVKEMKDRDASPRLFSLNECGPHILRGGLYATQGIAALVKLDLQFDTLGSACGHLYEAFKVGKAEKQKWTPQLQDLMDAAEKSLLADNFDFFKDEMHKATDKKRRFKKKKHTKMVCFSIISHLQEMVTKGRSVQIREAAMQELLKIACPDRPTDDWLKEPHIFEVMLDALHEIHKSVNEHSDRAQEEIQRLLSADHDKNIQQKADSWKSDIFMDTMDVDVVDEGHGGAADVDELFDIIRKEIGPCLTAKDVEAINHDLREQYGSDDFAKVPSFINEEQSSHVKDFEHDIVRYEEIPILRREIVEEDGNHLMELVESKKRIRTEISMKDIMKPKTVDKGRTLTSKDRKYLLLGDPGSGKTSIAKHFAYCWAKGEMGGGFEAVYVLRVRSLTNASVMNDPRKKDLASTVAIEYGKKCPDEKFEALKMKVEDDLERPAVLLILDGVDEGDEAGTNMVQDSLKHNCHILLTSRPYNLRKIRSDVGIEMECLGMNDAQLKRFIQREVPKGKDDLINQLATRPSIWKIARIPVTAVILCCVWNKKQEATSSSKELPKNHLGLYEDMSNYIWDRYVKKLQDAGKPIPDRERVFNALEKIAFAARKEGVMLMPEELVMRFAPKELKEAMKDSGFILLQSEGNTYQFAHLTFQEFYAGLSLARRLTQGTDPQSNTARTFIASNRYRENQQDTLSFMMQKAVSLGGESTNKMFEIVDQKPCDQLGMMDSLLKIRIVDAVLAAEDDPHNIGDCRTSCNAVMEAVPGIFGSQGGTSQGRGFQNQAKYHDTFSKNLLKRRFFLYASRMNEKTAKDLQMLIPAISKLKIKRPDIWNPVMALLEKGGEGDNAVITMISWLLSSDSLYEVPEFLLDHLQKRCANERSPNRDAACECIIQLCWKASSSQRMVNAERLWQVLISLCSDRERNIRDLSISGIVLAIKNADECTKRAIWDLIARNPNKKGKTVLEETCNDGDEEIRAQAIKALIELTPTLKEAIPIEQSLSPRLKDPEVAVRRTIAERLDKISTGGQEAAKTAWRLLSQLLNDENITVRKGSLKNLQEVAKNASIDKAAVIEHMSVRLTKDRDVGIRIEALRQLADNVSETSGALEGLISSLEQTSNDKVVEVRKQACKLLASISEKDPAMAKPCMNVLADKCKNKSEHVDVRIEAMRCIASFVNEDVEDKDVMDEDKEDLMDVLQQAFSHDEVEIRKEACKLIASICQKVPSMATTCMDVLKDKCVDKDEHVAVRIEAIRYITKFVADKAGDSKGLMNVLEQASSDESVEMSIEACRLIASICGNDPAMTNACINVLKKKCMDGNEDIHARIEAMRKIASFVAEDRDDKEALMAVLQETSSDGRIEIGEEACQLMTFLCKRAPSMAKKCKEVLKKLVHHQNGRLSIKAMRSITSLNIEATDEFEGMTEALAHACTHGELDVHLDACRTILPLLDKAPAVAEQCLGILKIKWEKEKCDIRDTVHHHLLKLSSSNELEDNPVKIEDTYSWLPKDAMTQASCYSIAKQMKMDHFESILSAYLEGSNKVLLSNLKTMQETVKKVERLMLTAAKRAFGQSGQSAHRRALDVLGMAVEITRNYLEKSEPGEFEAALTATELAVNAAKNDSDNRRSVLDLIQKIPSRHLFEYYWKSKSDETIAVISERLLNTAVTVKENPAEGMTDIVIHEASDEIQYTKETDEVEHLVALLKQGALGLQPLVKSLLHVGT